MEEVIRKLINDNYPQVVGRIVEYGQIILEDKYGNPLPYETIDYIRDNLISNEEYLLRREISQFELQGAPVPEELMKKLEKFND